MAKAAKKSLESTSAHNAARFLETNYPDFEPNPLFDYYYVKITLLRDMLGTNPMDTKVLDSHIHQLQRRMILENTAANKEINKYKDAIDIPEDKMQGEQERLIAVIEEMIGRTLEDDEMKKLAAEGLDGLKETFASLEIKGATVFFRDKETKRPCIGDHMILGFLKAAGESLSRATTGTKERGVMNKSASYTQSIINQHVRCQEQFITFDRDIQREENGAPYYLQRSLRAMTAKGPRVSLAKSEVVQAGASLEFILKAMKNSPCKEEHLRMMFSTGEMSGLGQWRNSGCGQFAYQLTTLG